MKKIISIMLSFAMIIAAVPCMAFADEAESHVNWDDFYFTNQPQYLTTEYGEAFSLSVEVNVPEGAEITGYQWYYNDGINRLCEGCNSPTLTVNEGDPYYPAKDIYGNQRVKYHCVVTAAEKDSEGNVISSGEITSKNSSAVTERTFLGSTVHVLVNPWSMAFSATVMAVGMSFGAALPFSPLIFIAVLVMGFFDSIDDVINPQEMYDFAASSLEFT